MGWRIYFPGLGCHNRSVGHNELYPRFFVCAAAVEEDICIHSHDAIDAGTGYGGNAAIISRRPIHESSFTQPGGYYYPGRGNDALRTEMRRHLDCGYSVVNMKIGGAQMTINAASRPRSRSSSGLLG